jgi:hypothetical protein
MYKFLIRSAACAFLFAAVSASARDAIDGERLVIKPFKNDSFQTGDYQFGKGELWGYVGELKETKKIKGMLLRDGGKATDEQKHIIATIAQAQQLDAMIELDGKQQALVDPKPAPAPAADAAAPAATQ